MCALSCNRASALGPARLVLVNRCCLVPSVCCSASAARPICSAPAQKFRITGRFELDSPDVRRDIENILGGALDDNEIILTRRLQGNGRSHAYANDRPVVLATLKQIGNLLVDIHGQRETESLLHPAYQLQLLDAYGHLDAAAGKIPDAGGAVRELRRQHTHSPRNANSASANCRCCALSATNSMRPTWSRARSPS